MYDGMENMSQRLKMNEGTHRHFVTHKTHLTTACEVTHNTEYKPQTYATIKLKHVLLER